MSNDCPVLPGADVEGLISTHLATVMGYGNTSFDATMEALNALSTGTISVIQSQKETPNPPSVSEPNPSTIPAFIKPDKPTLPTLVYTEPDLPQAPTFGEIAPINLPAPQDFTGPPPLLDPPDRPANLQVTWPTEPADPTLPTYPDRPSLTYPDAPDLIEIQLPELVSPDFTAIQAWLVQLRAMRPEAPAMIGVGDYFSMVAAEFSATKLSMNGFLADYPTIAALGPALATQLAGHSIGIPAAVAQALREQVYASEDEQAWRAQREGLVDWLARGFTLPSGILDAKLWAVNQQARDQKAAASMALWAEEAKLEIQAYQFAIGQGVAYEATHTEAWFKLYDLSRTLVAQYIEFQIKLLEAALERYKAQWAGMQAEFEQVKLSLQMEMTHLEVYKSELDAAKLQGDLNEQQITLYRSLLEALKTRVEVYVKEVDGANAQLTAEMARFTVFSEKIKAGIAKVGAYEAEWKGFAAANQGEESKLELFKSLLQAYDLRLKNYTTKVDVKKTTGGFQMETNKQRLEQWMGQLDEFKTRLQGEVSRLGATAQVYDTRERGYASEVQAESGHVETEIKRVGVDVSLYQSDKLNALEELKLTVQKMLETSRLTVSALGDIAHVGAQLSAGALSALNMSAQLSGQHSNHNQSSCAVQYSYSE